MPANKDREQPGKWIAQFYYTDWTGERKKKRKRGFSTRRDALAWEHEFLKKHRADIGMEFSSFAELYMEDISHRVRASTLSNKHFIIQSKILPYFGKRPMNAITAPDIRKWQNELLNLGYSKTYLKLVNSQLAAIFNYAVKFYGLAENPCHKAGSIGKSNAEEMQFWTLGEYKQFREALTERPRSYMAFELLFFTGIRIGELLALTPADIDAENGLIKINKSYNRLNGQDIISPPKTPKSNREIAIPEFLCSELLEYMSLFYDLDQNARLFPHTKHYLAHEMKNGCAASNVKRIRLHDIRHSHASLLIELGFSPLLIAERLGHERVETTLNTYAHLWPHKQQEVVNQLQRLNPASGSAMVLKNPEKEKTARNMGRNETFSQVNNAEKHGIK